MSNINLSSQLQSLSKKNFTGSLSVVSSCGPSWKFYFRLGRFIWLTSTDNYCQEKWQRLIKSLKSDSNNNNIKIKSTVQKKPDIYYYYLLQLIKRVKASDKQVLTDSIINIFVEIIFDLIQHERCNSEKLTYSIIDNDKLPHIVTFIKTDLVYQKALLEWKQWFKAGLSSYSPNCFPFIKSLPQLENKLDKKLIKLIDGKTSLRDLAIKSNLELISLTKLLVPFISEQTIILSYVAISPRKSIIKKNLPETSQNLSLFHRESNEPKNPTCSIICVDDSPLIIRDLEKIVCEFSCDFLGIQDALKAIPLIIKKSPDLIFLDLIMPIMGGYELCSRIRKIPDFKDTPIIILTGKDGIIDKFKAKLVGATDFISKSASPVQIQALILKYLEPIKQYDTVDKVANSPKAKLRSFL